MVELVTWFVKILRGLRFLCIIRFVVDGAYAARPVLKPLVYHVLANVATVVCVTQPRPTK